MKNEKAENLIKDKMNAADAMPGVSFDTSAAWDKLEYRLENKPKKNRKALYYWSAAAASLVFFVALVLENRAPEIEIVKEIKPVKINEGAIKIPSMAAVPAINTNSQTKRVEYKNTPTLNHKTRSAAQAKPDAIAVFNANEPHTFPEAKKDTVRAPKASPLIAVKPKMKEIHINDLVDEDYEIERIRRENRMASEGFRLFRPQTGNVISSKTEQEDIYPSHNTLKIKFN